MISYGNGGVEKVENRNIVPRIFLTKKVFFLKAKQEEIKKRGNRKINMNIQNQRKFKKKALNVNAVMGLVQPLVKSAVDLQVKPW